MFHKTNFEYDEKSNRDLRRAKYIEKFKFAFIPIYEKDKKFSHYLWVDANIAQNNEYYGWYYYMSNWFKGGRLLEYETDPTTQGYWNIEIANDD